MKNAKWRKMKRKIIIQNPWEPAKAVLRGDFYSDTNLTWEARETSNKN